MPTLKGISLISHGSALLFITALLIGFGAIYFMYRSTTPPVRSWKRLLLAFVRLGALCAIIGMIFTPILHISYENTSKPTLAIAIDTSSSMDTINSARSFLAGEQDGTKNKLIATVSSDDFSTALQDFDLRYYTFDRSVEEISGQNIPSLTFNGEGTDIAHALQQITRQSEADMLRGILLLSDGLYNQGGDPVTVSERSPVPVYPIGFGDPSPQNDVMISNIQANEITYSGKEYPVTVSVQSTGYESRTATLMLRSQNELIDSEVIRLGDDYREQSVTFNYTPGSAGVHALNVSVSGFEDEISSDNNNRELFVKVLESRLNIFIAAGRPSPDFTFLKRSLESVEEYSVTSVVQKPGGMYNENEENSISGLPGYHVIVLIDFPGSRGTGRLVRALREEIADRKKPVLYISGRSLSSSQLQQLADILSVRNFALRGGETEVFVKPVDGKYEHPVFALSEDREANRAVWLKLPPVFTPGVIPVPFNDAEIMARVDISRSSSASSASTTPLIFSQRTEERKVLFLNIYALWRWKFLALRDPDMRDFYDVFLQNCMKWLVNRENSKQFTVSTNKDFYRNGERITVNAQLYTPRFDPVDDAEVQVTIRKESSENSRILNAVGRGRYSASLAILEPGEYSLTGSAAKSESLLGADTTEIIVGSFSIEQLRTTADSTLLAQIAVSSWGNLVSPENVSILPELLDTSPVISLQTVSVDIWNKAWLLTAVILLLCLEWFFRKKLGML